MTEDKNQHFWDIFSSLERVFCVLAMLLQMLINVLVFLGYMIACFFAEANFWQWLFFVFFSICLFGNTILFVSLPFSAQRVNIWVHKPSEQVKTVHQRILRRCVLALVLQSIPVLLHLFLFLSTLESGRSMLFKLTRDIFTFFGGWLLTSLYSLQFFRPTLRKRIIFGSIFFPAVIVWYICVFIGTLSVFGVL